MDNKKLLVCVIEKEERLEDVLEALLEVGITGASILDTRGMFEYMADEIPLFAGFRGLIQGTNPTNKMILSVLPDTETLRLAMDTIESVYGDFSLPNTGIMFSLDIGTTRGLKS